MSKWKRQPQECEGTYFFSGTFYVTQGIRSKLTEDEIFEIITEVKRLIKEKMVLIILLYSFTKRQDKNYFLLIS